MSRTVSVAALVISMLLASVASAEPPDREGDRDGNRVQRMRLVRRRMGFTSDAYLTEPEGELMCAENTNHMNASGAESAARHVPWSFLKLTYDAAR